jgi:hypothetical protein
MANHPGTGKQPSFHMDDGVRGFEDRKNHILDSPSVPMKTVWVS